MTSRDQPSRPQPSRDRADRCPIRVLRLARGLSQDRLCLLVPQLHKPDLSAYENGRKRPGPVVIRRLAVALEVDPVHLVERLVTWRALYFR